MEEVPRRTSLVPLAFPLFVHCLIRVEAEGLLDYQGRAGIISIVRWNLRPVIVGVEKSSPKDFLSVVVVYALLFLSHHLALRALQRCTRGRQPGHWLAFQNSPDRGQARKISWAHALFKNGAIITDSPKNTRDRPKTKRHNSRKKIP